MAHVILGYKPISTSFQAPKYVIKAKDSRLHKINVAASRFLAALHLKVPIELSYHLSAVSRAPEDEIMVVEVSNSEEDFRAFDHP